MRRKIVENGGITDSKRQTGGWDMQNLSAQASGNACTIKWMFGAPEILNFLREGHIEEGSTVKVIQNFCGNMIVSAAGRQFAVSKDIADRIKV